MFTVFTGCLPCFSSSSQLKINSRSLKILRLLGEGGFSYVYLVSDTATGSLYALKKIRCPFGQESVSQALKEVEAYTLFTSSPHIIHSVDHIVAADKSDPGAKTVYILLPYYRRGNLQDMINANLVNGEKTDELRLMKLILTVCQALKAMHQYRVQGGDSSSTANGAAKSAGQMRQEAASADRSAASVPARNDRGRSRSRQDADMDEDEVEQEPLMDDEVTISQEGVAPGGLRAYAHRDIKPGNIMLSDDGASAILMDLGSLAPTPTHITSRSLALAVQDMAAEHSTMPYRAPELFDVKTGSIVDAKVDIWSLGCTLYACLVGKSPFEARSEETGGSLSLCVLGGDWRFPDEEGVSKGVREVVQRCLRVEPAERPDVDELITMVERVIGALERGGQ
ncbi:MAG: hypothetical protein M1829_006303 [Trizodia sp. TS-e1964]|nr:MAG: hypothetical protein M1829_006303 [Trizodia sp. TS-e1964]